MNKLLVLICCLVLLPVEGFACPPMSLQRLQSQKPWMRVSDDGKFLLKMIPGQWKGANNRPVLTRKPYTIAYAIEDNGYLKQMWSIREVYHKPFIASSGRNMLGMLNISKINDDAFVLYRDGKQARTFKPTHFGVTTTMLRPLPCRGMSWIHEKEGSLALSNDNLFIRTVVGKTFLLNINTGKVTPK